MKPYIRLLLICIGCLLAVVCLVGCGDDGTCRHTYDGYREVPPTCTEAGYYVYTCTTCGEDYIMYAAEDDRAMQPRGHFAAGRQVTRQPSCTELGEYSVLCADCSVALTTEPIDMLAHTYEGTYVNHGATHSATCSVCGHEQPAEACVYEVCALDDLMHAIACPLCHAIKEGETTHAHDHTPSEIVQSSTCLTQGYAVRRCRTCGHERRTELSLAKHTYSCEMSDVPGEGHRSVCTVCGDGKTGDFEAHAIVTTIKNGILVRGCELCPYQQTPTVSCFADGTNSSALSGSNTNFGFGDGTNLLPSVKDGAYVFEKNATTEASQAQLYLKSSIDYRDPLPTTRVCALVSLRLKQGETAFTDWGLRIINDGGTWGAHSTGTSKSIHILDQKTVNGKPTLVDANGTHLVDFPAGGEWIRVDIEIVFLHAQDAMSFTYYIDNTAVRTIVVNNTLNNNHPHGLYFSAGGVPYTSSLAKQPTLYMDDIAFAVFDD